MIYPIVSNWPLRPSRRCKCQVWVLHRELWFLAVTGNCNGPWARPPSCSNSRQGSDVRDTNPGETEKPYVSQAIIRLIIRTMIGCYCSDSWAVTGTVPPHSQVLPTSSSSAQSIEHSSSRSELLASSSIEHFCPGSQMQHACASTDNRCKAWTKTVPTKKNKEKAMKIQLVRRQVGPAWLPILTFDKHGIPRQSPTL